MDAIREAGLPDATKNTLINEVIAGGSDAQLIAKQNQGMINEIGPPF